MFFFSFPVFSFYIFTYFLNLKIKTRLIVGYPLLFYHKVQIKTSTAFFHFDGPNWGGLEEAAIQDQKKYMFLRARRSKVGNLYEAWWHFFFCVYFGHCFEYCFGTEWHIHSQAGREMNATWLFFHCCCCHFAVLFFYFFFKLASLSRYNTIHKNDLKIQYLQVWSIQRGRH